MLTYKRKLGLGYFQKGKNPKLLIHSGTHGDEYQVIPFVTTGVKKYLRYLPDFIYIPKVSPSAVKLKRRNNQRDIDINRNFFDNSQDTEVKSNLKLHRKFKFNLCVDFHEDPETDSFYLYDDGLLNRLLLSNLRQKLSKAKVRLFTGIDDPDDPILGHKFMNGYKSFKGSGGNSMAGTFWDWSIKNGITKRMLVVEVPGKITPKQKLVVVDIVFKSLILPLVL